jgi:glycogen synthase
VRTHPRARAALAELLSRIDQNQKILHARLRAARTIAEVLARAIREGQSDGTYSAQIWRENRR